jgi:hypothetical protein
MKKLIYTFSKSIRSKIINMNFYSDKIINEIIDNNSLEDILKSIENFIE